ncbi:Helix-turn-helix XRE-family like proteins [Proteiniphilum saccharofermentans]|jgi:DNA-binding XRE family transcriptional regulator|uniref:Helix-turn-helix XRE-family like proteins n=1 Tax=Proteiniphilum saccharofermentans TaxID=1642647 RepID=A0A1R3TF40_9BACT|nr:MULTISPECIES: helix-turn-helix transcriptional regulator [Proteiniphilum]MDY9917843.1 helix-turn-helix transcriptional regulator [Proteiniphilum sp.]SCD22264.1 Helix-turn-helix XRE-family like proteins [Proteiniphilum saccharofermentans]SEA17772.1 Helix-turn-helix [Porphyromonadaceae bacterium KH3R12]SFS44414.1 Helix-turn-helix [Porphyromonadaceae bacterium NLAE-zl-C104]
MNKKEFEIHDLSAELEKEFGKPGTPERAEFDERAYAFYTGQVILDARKSEKITQTELAKRLGVDKSYISKIENGIVNPSVGFFYRIMNALNLRIEITRQVG